MKSYKELLNELAHHDNSPLRELLPEESAALKKEILNIYNDTAALCKKHDLTIMLGGGSCLGAIRHKGFIPWDDDLDVMMTRPDYNKFKILCESGELGDKYEFCYPSKHHDSPIMFMKVYRKHSLLVEMGSENSSFPKGIFLDIFIIEGTSKNIWIRTYKGYVSNILRLIANMVALATSEISKSEKEFAALDKKLQRQFTIRYNLGKIFSIINHKTWVNWYDKFVENENIDNLICIPTGRKLYLGEVHESKTFFPVRETLFEGIPMYIPNDFDTYLKKLYGNYMQIPPVEKRERHFIVDFKLPDN